MNCKNKPFRKRIGNDVGITWKLFAPQVGDAWRQPYDLTGKVLTLELKHPRLGVVELTDYSVEGNEVLWAFLGKDQQYTGVYTLTLWEGKGTETQRVIDAVDFLELVPSEAQIQECCHGEIESQYSTMGVDIVTIIDGADYETRSHAVAAFAPKTKTAEDIAALQSGKVDKESGKGLSEANFTNGEKSKLGGIEAGAQKNVIEAVKVNGTARPVSGKAVDIPVPTKVGELENDRGYTTPAVVSAAVLEETNRAKEAEGAIAGRVSVIESKESGWDGKYTKPSGGIPKGDLASSVQQSLSKADTALQTHQDISGKADKSYVDAELAKKAGQEQVTAIVDQQLTPLAGRVSAIESELDGLDEILERI